MAENRVNVLLDNTGGGATCEFQQHKRRVAWGGSRVSMQDAVEKCVAAWHARTGRWWSS